MKKKILNFWESIRTSFWFLPAMMSLLAVLLSVVSIFYDEKIPRAESLPGWLTYKGDLEGARVLLSTIAGSMITVAGVTFSITIVALALTSSQLGPRLLRNFMSDMKNQVVLGTFIATYLYCLLVLRSIGGPAGEIFIPHISLALAMVMAVASLGVLIYFIHHISISIQADNVIALVFEDIESIFGRHFSKNEDAFKREESSAMPPESYEQGRKKYSFWIQKSGYIKDIDVEAVFSFSKEVDGIIKIEHRPGDYILPGKPLLHIFTPKDLEEKKVQSLKQCFLLGEDRSSEHDNEFAIKQLVEIALRALSPGINDPFTAITCIDRLSTALILFMENANNAPYIYDENGNLRVIENLTTFDGVVNAAFNQIRQIASHNPAIVIRLLERIKDVALLAKSRSHKDTLLEHAALIKNNAHEKIQEKWDLRDIDERYKNAVKVLSIDS